MTKFIMDASAVLAVVNNEPGADYVWDRMPGSSISSVNYAEVITKLIEYGSTALAAREAVDDYLLEVISVDAELGARMGTLHEVTQRKNISLGDRACLALAERLKLPILTADRAWAKLDLGLTIELIR